MSAWPNDPNGSLVPLLEASVTAAQRRHPSASGHTPGTVLTATDRCDSCRGPAVYRVGKLYTMAAGGDMTGVIDFCMHHWRKNMPAMEGWQVIGANPELAASMGGTPDGNHAT